MTEGFLPCVGGPFDGHTLYVGDDTPNGWRIIVRAVMETSGVVDCRLERVAGVYVRKGDRLIWEDGIK